MLKINEIICHRMSRKWRVHMQIHFHRGGEKEKQPHLFRILQLCKSQCINISCHIYKYFGIN